MPAVILAGFLGINRSSVFYSGFFSHLKVEQSRQVPKTDDIKNKFETQYRLFWEPVCFVQPSNEKKTQSRRRCSYLYPKILPG
jgi:hypothetical protein